MQINDMQKRITACLYKGEAYPTEQLISDIVQARLDADPSGAWQAITAGHEAELGLILAGLLRRPGMPAEALLVKLERLARKQALRVVYAVEDMHRQETD